MADDQNLIDFFAQYEDGSSQLAHGDCSSVQLTCPSAPHQGSEQSKGESSQLQEKSASIAYGELVILGYNGDSTRRFVGEQKRKFALHQRQVPNGVKKSQRRSVTMPQHSEAVTDPDRHSVCYTLSRSQSIVLEYVNDDETDMFQIGRFTDNPIDFVTDTKVTDGKATNRTISRFACRILVSRKTPFQAKIFAAGFDLNRNIFLGPSAIKWQTNGIVDGFTTNGIHIMHPNGSFCGIPKPGDWMEVSVDGNIYSMRKTSLDARDRMRLLNGSNVLQDGTMIDLCGVTLLWRTSEGLIKSPTKQYLEGKVDELNAGRPLCPVRLESLIIPKHSANADMAAEKQPYVYLTCGHVQGLHNWGLVEENSKICPLCRQVGPAVRLRIGIEQSFYVDSGPPAFAFRPCGHAASEKTVKYWSLTVIPHSQDLRAVCPFCLTPLVGDPPYVKLVFQDHVY